MRQVNESVVLPWPIGVLASFRLVAGIFKQFGTVTALFRLEPKAVGSNSSYVVSVILYTKYFAKSLHVAAISAVVQAFLEESCSFLLLQISVTILNGLYYHSVLI